MLTPILYGSLKIAWEGNRLGNHVVQIVAQKLRTSIAAVAVKHSEELHFLFLNSTSNLPA